VFINEAIQKASPRIPYIRRKSWARLSEIFGSKGVRIQLTNSPDGCIIESDVEKENRRRWVPTAEDLVAEDWEPCL